MPELASHAGTAFQGPEVDYPAGGKNEHTFPEPGVEFTRAAVVAAAPSPRVT